MDNIMIQREQLTEFVSQIKESKKKIVELSQQLADRDKEINGYISDIHSLKRIIDVCREELSRVHYEWKYIIEQCDKRDLKAYDSEYDTDTEDDDDSD